MKRYFFIYNWIQIIYMIFSSYSCNNLPNDIELALKKMESVPINIDYTKMICWHDSLTSNVTDDNRKNIC